MLGADVVPDAAARGTRGGDGCRCGACLLRAARGSGAASVATPRIGTRQPHRHRTHAASSADARSLLRVSAARSCKTVLEIDGTRFTPPNNEPHMLVGGATFVDGRSYGFAEAVFRSGGTKALLLWRR